MIPSFYYGRGRHRKKILRFILYAISFCHTNWMDEMLGGGVGNKLPLDSLKMERIRQIIFKYFLLTLTQQEQG